VLQDPFQSAPGDEAGRNVLFLGAVPSVSSFNPLPAMKPGGTHTLGLPESDCRGFNPLPAMKPGGTCFSCAVSPSPRCFNPLPAMKPGGTR